jgi:hypothetical protein
MSYGMLQWKGEIERWMRDRAGQPDGPTSANELAEIACSTLGEICHDTLRPAEYWYEIAGEVWAEGGVDEGLEAPIYSRYD